MGIVGEYLVLMGEGIGGEDGSVGVRVGGRCLGGTNYGAYGDSLGGVGTGTAALGVGLEVARDEW